MLFSSLRVNYTDIDDNEINRININHEETLPDLVNYHHIADNYDFDDKISLVLFHDFYQNIKSNNYTLFISLMSYSPGDHPLGFQFLADEINVKIGSKSLKLTSYQPFTIVNGTGNQVLFYESFTYSIIDPPLILDITKISIDILCSIYQLTGDNLTQYSKYDVNVDFETIRINSTSLDVTWITLIIITSGFIYYLYNQVKLERFSNLDEYYIKSRFLILVIFYVILSSITLQSQTTIASSVTLSENDGVFFILKIFMSGFFCIFSYFMVPLYFSYLRKKSEFYSFFSIKDDFGFQEYKFRVAKSSQNLIENDLVYQYRRSKYRIFNLTYQITGFLFVLMVFVIQDVIFSVVIYSIITWYEFKLFNILILKFNE